MADHPLIACQHCATLHERVPLAPGSLATCVRCGYALYRVSAVSLNGWIALVVGAILVFAIANYFPIVTLSIGGLQTRASLPGALYLTWQQGDQMLAVMTGLFSFWFPLTQLLFVLWALLAIRARRLPDDFSYGMRLLGHAMHWSMVPVLMLGILVSLVKFAGMAKVQLGPGIWAFVVLAFLLTGLSRMTARRLWGLAEDEGLVQRASIDTNQSAPVTSCLACGLVQQLPDHEHSMPCQRCGERLHYRKPDQTSRVWALLLAAWIAYIPANVLPVMQIRTAASDSKHTILGGVIELWGYGSWDLALIVFIASIVVPMTKLLALMVLMSRRSWRGPVIQRQRTRMYELVEFIGQWSMLDVFVVILMGAMLDFPGISRVIPGPAAVSFGVVVILTMLAAMSYDPRSGWDKQREEDDGSGQASTS
ncbi:paraquat-inducible protein A [Pusillimonas sp. MFBS29]|uniref:paraquat-inducible protein A n=1 Tax=Pusillimonas sp. MFBS29 TaxID=2886690 RepID=UPI001D10FE34|nr:paraquat-inducible protein A [Pusillimonas sp. MFBS29]MCC2596727.1 paraquat-inducible protein A [Pusillimonas sp. MFBS29]